MSNEQKPKSFWGTLGDAIARGSSNRPKSDQQQPKIRAPKPKSGCCARGGK